MGVVNVGTVGPLEFEVSLVCTVSSSIAMMTQRNPPKPSFAKNQNKRWSSYPQVMILISKIIHIPPTQTCNSFSQTVDLLSIVTSNSVCFLLINLAFNLQSSCTCFLCVPPHMAVFIFILLTFVLVCCLTRLCFQASVYKICREMYDDGVGLPFQSQADLIGDKYVMFWCLIQQVKGRCWLAGYFKSQFSPS